MFLKIHIIEAIRAFCSNSPHNTSETPIVMSIDNVKFTKLCRDLSKLDLFGDGPPPPPYGAQPTVAKVLAAVDSGSNALPPIYRDNYVTPLKAALPASLTNPDPRRRIDGEILETVTGAVYDHAAGSPVAGELGRFLAVISNLYRTFLDRSARAHISLPAVETLPPLAVFQSSGKGGPFTVPVDAMMSEFAVPVGVVSLPSVYRPHPVLWASLAHEVGGHDVLHADDGLLDELGAGMRKMFGGGKPAPGGQVTMNQFLGFLWSWWIDEAASDVYGLLNIGPSFASNLAFFFAALNAPQGGLGPNDAPTLRTESGFDPPGSATADGRASDGYPATEPGHRGDWQACRPDGGDAQGVHRGVARADPRVRAWSEGDQIERQPCRGRAQYAAAGFVAAHRPDAKGGGTRRRFHCHGEAGELGRPFDPGDQYMG